VSRQLSLLFTWRTAIARSELRSTAKLVAFVLSLYMSELGDSCFPSIDTIAARSSLSRGAVSAALKTLIDEGWLNRRGGGGRGKSTIYTAVVPETARQEGGSETARLSGKPPGSSAETARQEGTTTSRPRHIPRQPATARARRPIWDIVVELYGEPLERGKAARGRIVEDLRQRLHADGMQDADQAVEEVRRRYVALAGEWGSRATARALVEHWHVAGRMAAEPKTRGLTPDEIAAKAIELRQEGR
jgi:hypothetical protein